MARDERSWQQEIQEWKEKALEAAEILKKISQPPLLYATVVYANGETVDVAHASGEMEVVHYNPQLKGKLKLGQTVRLSPETRAVIDIAGDIKSRCATTVKDILKDGRVKIDHHGLERVIQSAVPVKAGDNVLVDMSYSVVVESLGNSSKAYKIDRVPEVPWSSIGGLETTIEDIRDAIELPFKHPQIYAKFPNKKPAQGILLYGPPGCGKTMIGKAIAYNLALQKRERDGGELNGYFMYVAGPEFLQKWVGTGEAKVRELFSSARETTAERGDPVVIFIDEPETVLKQRGTGISSDATDSLVNQFLAELDGLRSRDHIYLVLATNRQDLIDPAIMRPGRIDKKINVPRPDQCGATAIFKLNLEDMPLAYERGCKNTKEYAEFSATEVYKRELPIAHVKYRDGSKDLLEYKHLFSGASAVSIVGRASDYAIKRGIRGEDCSITREDLTAAVRKEYEENRTLTNLITPEDVRTLAGAKTEQVVDVQPVSFGTYSSEHRDGRRSGR